MKTSDFGQDSHAPPARAVEAKNLSSEHERRMMCGMGRWGGFMTFGAVAVAAVMIAGLSFGWPGWLTAGLAGLGGISLLFLLPCLAMCVAMIWMMMTQGNSQSSKDVNRDRGP